MKQFIAAITILILGVGIVSAQQTDSEATSANYSLIGNVTGGGGTSSSANYTLFGSIGEFEAATSSSANYSLNSGYVPQIVNAALRILDVNGDGIISPEDAIFVINRDGAIKTTLNGIADVNKDGTINAADAQMIIDAFGTTP